MLKINIGYFFHKVLYGKYPLLYSKDAKEPHLFHFSIDTLTMLIKKCNFTPIKRGADFCQVDPYWRKIEFFAFIISKIIRKSQYLSILIIGKK